MRTAPLVVLVLVLAACGMNHAIAQDFDISRLADLETLVLRIEQEGLKRFTFEKVRPKLPEASIVFKAQNNTIDQEKEFRRAWIQAYDAIGKGLQEESRAAQKEKKQPWAKDLLKLF